MKLRTPPVRQWLHRRHLVVTAAICAALGLAGVGTVIYESTSAASSASSTASSASSEAKSASSVAGSAAGLATQNSALLHQLQADQNLLDTQNAQLHQLVTESLANASKAVTDAAAGVGIIQSFETEFNAICAAVRCGQPPLQLAFPPVGARTAAATSPAPAPASRPAPTAPAPPAHGKKPHKGPKH